MRVSGAERIWVCVLRVGWGDPYLRNLGSGFSRILSFDLTDSANRS